jgi:gliding motility-associated-like protein
VQPITISARPTIAFTFTDSVCVGTPTFFQDQSTAGGSTINYWQWTYDDSTGTATQQNPSHIFNTAGNHTVTLVSSTSGSNACAGTPVSQTVYVSSKPTAGIRWDTLCERQPVRLQDASASPGGEAITACWWDLGNGTFSNQCNPTLVYPTAGPRTIRHVVTNARGCVSDTFSITLTIADKPRVDFNFPNPVCNDSTLALTDASTVTNGTVSAWNWIFNNASIGSSASINGTFPFGNNQVGLSVSSSLGCFSDTLFKPFRLVRNPRIRMQFNDTCRYAPVSFSASEISPAIGIQSWNWSFGDGQTATANPTTHAYSNNGAYSVALYAISTEGCRSETIRDQVNIYGTNAFAGNDTIAAANQPIQLLASGGVSYEWTPSTGLNNPTIRNPIATVTQDITYYLKAYTPAGCVSYDTMKIVIYAGPDLYVPSAFTPNGDGLNDQLGVLPIGLRSFDYFAVYNRYGQLVFTTNNKNQKWDGRYKGYRQASGAYVWIASGTDFRNKPIFRKGTVLLLY